MKKGLTFSNPLDKIKSTQPSTLSYNNLHQTKTDMTDPKKGIQKVMSDRQIQTPDINKTYLEFIVHVRQSKDKQEIPKYISSTYLFHINIKKKDNQFFFG